MTRADEDHRRPSLSGTSSLALFFHTSVLCVCLLGGETLPCGNA